MKGINERPALAFGKTPEWALEEDRADQSAGSDRDQHQHDVSDDILPEFKSGRGEHRSVVRRASGNTTNAGASLRENGIACVTDDSGGKKRIRVLPTAEAGAREIVREVIEGVPLEWISTDFALRMMFSPQFFVDNIRCAGVACNSDAGEPVPKSGARDFAPPRRFVPLKVAP